MPFGVQFLRIVHSWRQNPRREGFRLSRPRTTTSTWQVCFFIITILWVPCVLMIDTYWVCVQKMDDTIQRINYYSADSVVRFENTYLLDSDLYGE